MIWYGFRQLHKVEDGKVTTVPVEPGQDINQWELKNIVEDANRNMYAAGGKYLLKVQAGAHTAEIVPGELAKHWKAAAIDQENCIWGLNNHAQLLALRDDDIAVAQSDLWPRKTVRAAGFLRFLHRGNTDRVYGWVAPETLLAIESGQVTKLPGLTFGAISRPICMLEDREGNLWAGTHADGLVRLRRRPVRSLEVQESDLSGDVWNITQAQDQSVWVSSIPLRVNDTR